jgi:hypothetical protein
MSRTTAVGQVKVNNPKTQGSTRLNVEDARKIRQLWSEGFTLSQLATLFGVHRATIQPVVKGRTWKEDATASVLDETDVLVVPRQELCPLAALSE